MSFQTLTCYLVSPLLLLLLAVSCKVDNVAPLDLSEFEEFELAQSPAMGFCPDVDVPYRATIWRQTNGRYVFETSIFVGGDPLADDCLGLDEGYIGEGCLVIHEVPARELSSAEVERIRQVFRDVEITWETYSGPGTVCIDPCRITSVRWDDLRLTASLTGCVEAGQAYRLVSSEELQEILQLLEELR